jgi:DNA repair exonuclease SbcCD ATPase subunit
MSDIFERGQELLSKFSTIQDLDEHLKGMVTNEEMLLEKAQERHKKCLGSIEEINLALETLKQAIVPLTERGLKRLKELVSFGLMTIFTTEKYSVDFEIKERGSDKTAVIWLQEELTDGSITRVQMRDSCGGGVKTVVALILRVFFILHYKQRRVVVMDEPFTDLNTVVLPGLFQFLRYTVEELGFEWLIVTQDDRFLPYADHTYKVKKGAVQVVGEAEETSV